MKKMMVIILLVFAVLFAAGCNKSDQNPEEPYNPYQCGGKVPNAVGDWTLHIYDQTSTETATIDLNVATQDNVYILGPTGVFYGSGVITMGTATYEVDMNKVHGVIYHGFVSLPHSDNAYVEFTVSFGTACGQTDAEFAGGINCDGNAVIRNIKDNPEDPNFRAYNGTRIEVPTHDGAPIGCPTFGSSIEGYWFDGSKK